MKIHPPMLAAVIAFWGWQTGQWLIAVPVAAMLCASFYVSLRWTLTTAHLTRVADFCMVFALLLGGLFYVSYGNPLAVILFFEWLPILLLPLALAHAYSSTTGTVQRMNLSVLFWSLRRRPPRGDEQRPALFDPWWPYFALWIVAAATANQRSEWFYIGLVALVCWPLVRVRPLSYRVGAWGLAFSLAIALGFGLQYGLNFTQGWLQDAAPEWLSASGSRTDPYRATTDIGHIGKLKESDSIVLRVTTADGTTPPRLLHRASYNAYFGAAWLARGVEFTPVQGAPNDRWPLAPAHAPAHAPAARVTLHDYSVRPNPVLSLPAGTSAIENLKAISAQRNPLGAVQIVREPGYFSYIAAYAGENAHAHNGGAPTAEDIRVPAREREAFSAVAAELGLSGKNAQAASASVEHVKQFFANGYQYSTFQKNVPLMGSPIVDFLHRSKSGHCEYFATATALLLRAGGIPARYATGFVVAEKNDHENAWLVRTRHAHAWVRAYVNGAWIDIDTTPPSWFAIEAKDASAWSTVTDLWSWLHFRASQAWASSDERKMLTGALLVVFPFALWLGWRLYRSRRTRENIVLKQILKSHPQMGSDSGFYRVEQQLTQQGWGRHAHETATDWVARLNTDSPIDTAPLAKMVELHNRYRFDPLGLSDAQRALLNDTADKWLANNTSATQT